MTTDPVVRVARDLRAIVDYAAALEAEAIAKANDVLMPGGLAMVALAHVASIETYTNRLDGAERRALAYGDELPSIEDDDDWLPPLQLLLFWSEAWRLELDMEFAPSPGRAYPSIATEANFLANADVLAWAWDNEPHFGDYADDVHSALTTMEALLAEGYRSERGVPCLSAECDGAHLVRPTAERRDVQWCEGHDGVCTLPHEHCRHDRGGLRDVWVCPSCDRRYEAEDYWRAVAHAAYVNAEWLPLEQAMTRTGAPRGSIQGWATRGQVARRRDPDSGRTVYRVADIEARRAGVVADESTAV